MKHLGSWMLFLLLIFLGLVYSLVEYIWKLLDYYNRVRILRFHVGSLALLGTMFFAFQYLAHSMTLSDVANDVAYLYYQRENGKDSQQDEHLRNTDERMNEMIKQQERVYNEGVEYTRLVNSQIKEIGERVSHDEGIAFGLFAGIGILQAIGLLKGKNPPPHVHHAHPPTGAPPHP